MNQREDYEHKEREVDGSYFWTTNKDVKYWFRCKELVEVKEFDELMQWHYEEQEKLSKHSLFHIGTHLYFTYKGSKYDISWTFYSDEYIVGLQKKLKAIDGVSNLQINFGRLD